MKQTVTLTLLAGLILCVANSSLADDYTPYYVATGGDDNNSCTQPDQPCKSISAAVLQKTGAGKSHIHIARGTYAESSAIDITAGKNIIFSGGWSSDFSGQQCQPGNTIITPAGQTYPLLFASYIDVAGQEATVDLRCLTLNGNGVANSRAIDARAHNGAIFTINFDQVLVTGCTGYVFNFSTDDNGSSGTVTMRDSTVADNPGNSGYSPDIMGVEAYGSSSLDLDLDRVRFVNNGAVQTMNELYGKASGSSRLDIQARNCLFSHRDPSHYSLINTTSSDSGTLNLSLLNTTVTTLQTSNPFILQASADKNSTSTLDLTNTLLTGATSSGRTTYILQRDTAAIDVSANYSILGSYAIHADDPNKVTWTSSNEVYGDPRLDTSGHLKKGSVAIDAGICGSWYFFGYYRIAPHEDMDGDKRPGYGQVLGCDIGADEFHAFPWPAFLPAILPHQ